MGQAAAGEGRAGDAVEAFLLHLGDHEWDKVAADLAPKAIVVVTRDADGEWVNSYQTGEEWLAALRRSRTPTRSASRLTNVKVTIDSARLAYVRADFQVVRDGKAQSQGVDQFTLAARTARGRSPSSRTPRCRRDRGGTGGIGRTGRRGRTGKQSRPITQARNSESRSLSPRMRAVPIVISPSLT